MATQCVSSNERRRVWSAAVLPPLLRRYLLAQLTRSSNTVAQGLTLAPLVTDQTRVYSAGVRHLR